MENEIKQKWNEILQFMKEQYLITDVAYRTWILNLSVHSVTDNSILISIDDSKVGGFSLSFIKDHYEIYLQTAIAEITGKEYELVFELKSKIQNKEVKNDGNIQGMAAGLNPKYTFDTFVIGSNNSFAQAASVAVAENPGSAYNPLFIYGGVGLGKTHLMQAIAHHIIDTQKNMKVLYVTSETFTNELIQSLAKKTMENFRQKYREADVLLIDDIQFIINKESTQEEFFHTFNFLYESGKQIIISSDKPPKEMKTLEERLSSRFSKGLPVDISAPDYETRLCILQKKAETAAPNIDNKILAYIAENVTSNIRALEGALNKTVAASKFKRKELTLDLARETITDFIEGASNKKLTLSYIVEIVAQHYELTPQEIFSKNRTAKIAYPRHIAIYLCKKYLDMSLSEIGKGFDGRDHTTIINSINRIESEIKTDPTLDENIQMIIKKIDPKG